MRCPSCGSNDCYKAEAVWEQGVVESSTTTRIEATSHKPFDGQVFSDIVSTSGSSTSFTVQKTQAAERLSPPVPRLPTGIGAFLLGLLISFLVMVIAGSQLDDGPQNSLSDTLWMIGAMCAIGASFTYLFHRVGLRRQVARADHEVLMEAWRRLWYCARCSATGDEAQFKR